MRYYVDDDAYGEWQEWGDDVPLEDIARKWVEEGDWGPQAEGATLRVCVYTLPEGADEDDVNYAEDLELVGCAEVPLPTQEPDCVEGHEHNWEWVAARGNEWRPGTTTWEVCTHCGLQRVTDTGACNGYGEHYTSVRYDDPDPDFESDLND
jgi:hypothetical protein